MAGIYDCYRRNFHSGKQPVIIAAAASETHTVAVTTDCRCQNQHPGSYSFLICRRKFRSRFQNTIFARQQIPPDIGDGDQFIHPFGFDEAGQKQLLAVKESGKINFSAECDVCGNILCLLETLQLAHSGAYCRN